MQYLIIGLYGTDDDAKARQADNRTRHINNGEALRQEGRLWYGGALVDDSGNATGSMYLVDFDDRGALDAWLSNEPYIVECVWKTVEIRDVNVFEPWQFNQKREFFEGRTVRA